jgi:inner membrane protein
MDNVTHTLIGVLVGEASACALRSSATSTGLSSNQRRNLYVTLMGVGSNLPDLDFVYSTITGSKLDYLLHHRGHTHTLLGIVAVALLLGLAAEWWTRTRAPEVTPSERLGAWLVALLAPTLHVAMDAANNYGVHPWWPINAQWFYGDSIFIIEPLFWAACAPLMFLLRTRAARIGVFLVLVTGVALAISTRMVPTISIVAYVGLATALSVAALRSSRAIAIGAGIALWLSVTILFSVTSLHMRQVAQSMSRDTFPNSTTLDQVLTPMPVNPFCWEAIFVQREADAVVLRRAMLSAVPTLISARQCPGRSLDIRITAPLTPVPLADTEQVKWHGQIASPVERLLQLWKERCQVDALMRFVRAPWLARVDGVWVLADLRYDREAQLGFAEIPVDPPEEACVSRMPDWSPPRNDLRIGVP